MAALLQWRMTCQIEGQLLYLSTGIHLHPQQICHAEVLADAAKTGCPWYRDTSSLFCRLCRHWWLKESCRLISQIAGFKLLDDDRQRLVLQTLTKLVLLANCLNLRAVTLDSENRSEPSWIG